MNDAAQAHELNPYAAPAAELSPAPIPSAGQSPPYYAMSARKALLMSFLTCGYYDLWFWWQHWRARREYGQAVSPFWRTVFAPFNAFGFRTSLTVSLIERGCPIPSMLAYAPLVYLVIQIVESTVTRYIDAAAVVLSLTFASALIRACTLFVFQTAANGVLEADDQPGPINQGATAGTIVAGLVGLLIWALIVVGTLLPE